MVLYTRIKVGIVRYLKLRLMMLSIIQITGSIARSASRRYLVYSGRFLRFFAPQGRHVAPMGVKFGMDDSPHPCQISPRRCNDKYKDTKKGVGPIKTEIFTQI